MTSQRVGLRQSDAAFDAVDGWSDEVAYAARWTYDAFGRTTWQSDDRWSGIIPHRFSTKERCWRSGLYYYGYRYYDLVTGRWPSRDPIGERGGLNVYSMVGNSPISQIDLLGLLSQYYNSLAEAIHHGGLACREEALADLRSRQEKFDGRPANQRVGEDRPRRTFEYGTRICCAKNGRGYYYSSLVTQRKFREVGITPNEPCQDGDRTVAAAHNHPALTPEPDGTGVGVGLSDTDMEIARKGKNRSLLNRGRIVPEGHEFPPNTGIGATFQNPDGEVVTDLYNPNNGGRGTFPFG